MDDIIVLSVNDCFAVRAWEKTFDTDKVSSSTHPVIQFMHSYIHLFTDPLVSSPYEQ